MLGEVVVLLGAVIIATAVRKSLATLLHRPPVVCPPRPLWPLSLIRLLLWKTLARDYYFQISVEALFSSTTGSIRFLLGQKKNCGTTPCMFATEPENPLSLESEDARFVA